MLHPALRVVEPLAHEPAHRVDTVGGDQLLEPALADTGGSERGEEVAVPDIRDADPCAAHADHVLHVLVATLNAHAGECQAALLVDVARERHVRAGGRVAAVGLVRLGAGGEEVLAAREHRHEDGVVGGVRVAGVGIVVEVGVAPRQVGVVAGQPWRLEPGAEHVDLEPLDGREELVVGGHDRAGEVLRGVEDGRAPGTKQRVRHLADDRVETVREHGQENGVAARTARHVTGRGRHGLPSSISIR